MAGPLAAIERFFERLFERPPARLFAARVEKEQLVRQLQRAMEAERQVTRQRTYAPSFYRVLLSGEDLRALDGTPGLLEDLGEGLRVHARGRGYVLRSRPRVVLDALPELMPGEVKVVAQAAAPSVESPPASVQEPPADAAAPSAGSASSGQRRAAGEDGQTAIFVATRPRVPSATISVRVPGRPPWQVPLNGGRLRVGRAMDNDIVLPDDRVSRHHGQINVRFGTLVYSDLGSTNGSFVNGHRVSEIALGPTDVLLLGRSALTIESGP